MLSGAERTTTGSRGGFAGAGILGASAAASGRVWVWVEVAPPAPASALLTVPASSPGRNPG
jgi:hypothetical protein